MTMTMTIHDLIQGIPEWLAYRASDFQVICQAISAHVLAATVMDAA